MTVWSSISVIPTQAQVDSQFTHITHIRPGSLPSVGESNAR